MQPVYQIEQQDQWRRDYTQLVKELKAQYSWAVSPSNKLDSLNAAAKNLRTELKRAFPGVKFSVRSSRFSGGNSIDISWSFGPTNPQVCKISNKYQDGHFDGMQDLYEYDRSAYGNAVSHVLGRAKFVAEQRDFPNEIHEQIGWDLCTLQCVEYSGQWTRGLLGSGDRQDLQSHVNQLLARTSFSAGERYVGVEYPPDCERTGACDWVRIRKEQA